MTHRDATAGQPLGDISQALFAIYDKAYEQAVTDGNQALADIRAMLWTDAQGPGKIPDLTTKAGRDAVVDAVRVLLESVQNYQRTFDSLSADATRWAQEAARTRGEHGELSRQIRDLGNEVDRLKRALDQQHHRGYNAALKYVARAARRHREERLGGKA